MSPSIHVLALVEKGAEIGSGTRIWAFAQVRAGARIGSECVIGSHAFVDTGVRIRSRCKIENGAMLFSGVELEDEVFVGPGAILTNDRHPRATNSDGTLKSLTDWAHSEIHVRRGASVGAGAVIVAPVVLGEFCVVGAGAVVLRDVLPREVVVGHHRSVGYCYDRVAGGVPYRERQSVSNSATDSSLETKG